MNFLQKFIFFMIYFFIENDAYRILGVFPINSRSHNNVFESAMRGLAKRGHQVEVVTHFEVKNPPKNYRTIINLSGTKEALVNNWSMEKVSIIEVLDVVSIIASEYGNDFCELLSLEQMQKLIKNPPKNPPYDLVITEACAANCYIGLGFVFKVPVITISTTFEFPWAGESVGNPPSTAFVPNIILSKTQISTFWDRLQNTWTHHISKYKFFWYTEEPQTQMMRKYLSPDIPRIREIEKRVALMFVNSYHSLFGVRPTSPAYIEIAGIQVEGNDAKLTPDLQNWMDESKHGVIYFTLGSMVLIETLPTETLLAIYASFAKIAPVRVLMKIINKDKLPAGLPKNVLTSPWIPQIPVLKHNNTRLFITHGGLNSVIEALYYGVPMLAVPLFGDQLLNVNVLTKKNMAFKMDYHEISEKSLNEALYAILHDSKYRDAAKLESHLFRDRPMNATDTITFWTEYIIRNGAVLRSPAVDMPWWKVELLDIYGFIILSIFLTIYIIKTILRAIFKIVSSRIHKKTD